MTTPLEIVSRALKDIGALEAGETPTADSAQDAFEMLNDLIDSWSNDSMTVFYKTEIVFPVVQNQIQYTLGPNGNIPVTWDAYFSGTTMTVVNGSLEDGYINLNMILSGTGVTPGTTISAFNTGAGGGSNYAGTYTLSTGQSSGLVSAGSLVIGQQYVISTAGNTTWTNIGATSNAVGTVFTATGTALGTGVANTVQTITAYYPRPVVIDSAFVRVTTTSNGEPIYGGGLDYPVAVLNIESYNSIGLKQLNGPWPKALYYQPTETMGTVYLWPNPAQGEMHVFADQLFTRYSSMYDQIVLPQGYTMALRWCLAERLMPMYGKASPTQIAMIQQYAGWHLGKLKRSNMKPQIVSRYEDSLLTGRQKDAGWILYGGFR